MKVYKTLPSGIRIVEYEDSLAAAIADMWNKSRDSWGGDSSLETEQSVIADHSAGSFFNVFIAMDGDKAVGYCSFDRYYKDANTSYVHVLNVRPDYHGHKIGKELVLMCVHRTIELGYPRVDIHTWPGNTKAVPLYKKCGFMWEDRADSTHLQNQIPTVLATELFKDFFETADWYDDSVREIVIKPDGVKVNGFELFKYEWAKNGHSLSVGFEKTGRRVYLVETDDYKIEMFADHHELAFGLSYGCRFSVENKTGKPLSVAIKGKNDGVVSFGYEQTAEVTGVYEFAAEFSVGEISQEMDTWRVHPCVLADVTVNGKRVEFGLGIEPRFPIKAELAGLRQAPRLGLNEEVFINITSALPQDAEISFALPQSDMLRFGQTQFSAAVEKGGKRAFATNAEVTGFGYDRLTVGFDIKLADGRRVALTRPLNAVCQSIEGGAFKYENEQNIGAANGIWRVNMNKNNNGVVFSRAVPSGHANVNIAKLGKPYDDEFNLLSPEAVRFEELQGGVASFEADFASLKYAGIVLTAAYRFTATGVLYYFTKVKNRSDKPQSLHVMMRLWSSVGRRAVLHYDGAVTEIRDDRVYGFSDIDYKKIDENWIFDTTENKTAGLCWPAEYKPHAKWGEELEFEIPTGELLPGQCFKTKPVAYMCGVFSNYNDFRNYVMGFNEAAAPYTANHLEVIVGGYNPVVSSDALEVAVVNSRQRELEGEIALNSASGLIESTSIISGDKPFADKTALAAKLNPSRKGVGVAEVSMRYKGFELTEKRALLLPDAACAVSVGEENGVFTVTNGQIEYKACAGYSDAVYSLTYEGRQWLHSSYPTPEPYGWWNPFVGGIRSELDNMSASLVLREPISAAAAEAKDCFGNLWRGVRTSVSVKTFEEHKGISYDQYFLTLPGVPILCFFIKLNNGTNHYKKLSNFAMAHVCGKENLSDLFVEYVGSDGAVNRLRMGKDDNGHSFDRYAAFSYEGEAARREKLHIFHDASRDEGTNGLGYDVNISRYTANAKAAVRPGEAHVLRPTFLLLTDCSGVNLAAMRDFERITFDIK